MAILLLIIAFIVYIWLLMGVAIDITYEMLDEGPLWKKFLVALLIGGPLLGLIIFPVELLVDKLALKNLRG